MVELGDGARNEALWRRWRAESRADRPVATPDAMALAAYAEGRMSETEAEAIEAWLALYPAALAEVIAARDMAQHPPHLSYAAIVAHAGALVPAGTSNVVSLRRPAPRWRSALAWSGIAASLVMASMVGFEMGSDAYAGLSDTQISQPSQSDGLDTPASLDSYLSDDSGT